MIDRGFLNLDSPFIFVSSFRERQAGLEVAWKLEDRASSDYFRYLILSSQHGKRKERLSGYRPSYSNFKRTSTLEESMNMHSAPGHNLDTGGIEHDLTGSGMKEGKRFLHLYSSKSILHETTVDALLTWLGASMINIGYGTVDSGEVGKLGEIGDTLKSDLRLIMNEDNQHFSGSDVVSCLLKGGYTPTRASALTLGMELASSLSLFKHASDDSKMLLDNDNENYVLCDSEEVGDRRKRFLPHNSRGIRNLDVLQGLSIGICGHTVFESDLTDVLKNAGLAEGQILRFPGGSTALSKLKQFLPEKDTYSIDEIGSDDGCDEASQQLTSTCPVESAIPTGFHKVDTNGSSETTDAKNVGHQDSDGNDEFKDNASVQLTKGLDK